MKNNKDRSPSARNKLANPSGRDFDGLLDAYQVEEASDFRGNGSYLVTHENEGTIASFVHEKDALLFRLMKINIDLNGK